MNCTNVKPNTLADVVCKIGVNNDPTTANLSSVENFITRVTNLALDFAFILSVIMILYSAFLYVSSNGEESKAEAAKKTLTWSIVGFVVIFIAQLILSVIKHEVLVNPNS